MLVPKSNFLCFEVNNVFEQFTCCGVGMTKTFLFNKIMITNLLICIGKLVRYSFFFEL